MDGQSGGIVSEARTHATARTKGLGPNRLTDRGIRAYLVRARVGKAPTKKLSDGGGLYITLTPAGTAVWRIKFRYDGKERLYSPGIFPSVSLEAARAAREVVKAYLREGRDPLQARDVERAEAAVAGDNTFASVAADWLAKRKKDWSAIHYTKSSQALERDVLPTLGALPIAEITSAMIAGVIEHVIQRGVRDTASKILWHCVCVFRFAKAKGLTTDNPAEAVREMLPRRRVTTRRPALLDIDALRDLLRRAELANLSPAVRLAHRVCAFTAQRLGNVVNARWEQFALDGDAPTWTIPRAEMKAKERPFDHAVLLSSTIAAELRAWKQLTGGVGLLFPSPTGTGTPISREAVEKVYKQTLNLRGKHSPHGWRSSFSTLARDAGFPKDAVELTLDHLHANDVVRAYDRGERLVERKRLVAWWDGQLTGAPLDAKVIPLRPTGTRS
jgi:integrase